MAQTSFLAALCLILSSLEYAVPKPLPFMRIGLANLPVIVSLRKLGTGQVLLLVLLKVLVQALISGTLFSYVFVFSVAGSFASALVMLCLVRLCPRLFSDFGVTLAGSLANNAAQIVCARFILFGSTVRYIAPVLLACGLVSGCVLGAFVLLFENRSQWYRLMGTDALLYPQSVPIGMGAENEGVQKKILDYAVLALALAACVVFLLVRNVYAQWAFVFAFFVAACLRKKKPVKVFPSLLLTVSVVALALLVPSGAVLLKIGRFRVTEGALVQGLRRSGVLVGMVFLSQAALGGGTVFRGKGKIGRTVGSVFWYASLLRANNLSLVKGAFFKGLDDWLFAVCKKNER